MQTFFVNLQCKLMADKTDSCVQPVINLFHSLITWKKTQFFNFDTKTWHEFLQTI